MKLAQGLKRIEEMRIQKEKELNAGSEEIHVMVRGQPKVKKVDPRNLDEGKEILKILFNKNNSADLF